MPTSKAKRPKAIPVEKRLLLRRPPISFRKAAVALAIIVAIGGYLVVRYSRAATPIVLKESGVGLYVISSSLPLSNQPSIDHSFVNIGWSTLEPTRGQFNWAPIDTVIANNPTIKFRLRLEAGINAPTWLNSVSGPCINLIDKHSGSSGCVPRFWTPAYLAEYKTFIDAAGARYDPHPRVLDVVNGACMTFTAEPFIMGGPANMSTLFNAGLTKALDENCLSSSFAMMSTAFPHTRMSLATFDGWQEPAAVPQAANWPDELAFLQSMRSQYGSKISYQNDGLADQTCNGSTTSTMYCYMQSIAPPKGFQQGCGSKVAVCDQASVLDHGIALGGCFLEHATWLSLGAAQASYDAKLKANPGCKDSGNYTPPPSPSPTSTQTPLSTPKPTPIPSNSILPTPTVTPPSTPSPIPEPRSTNGLRATYYPSIDFTGVGVSRLDANVNFDWALGSPVTGIPADNFSARWTGRLTAPVTGNYKLSLTGDDGVRLFLDGKLLADGWFDHGTQTYTGTASLTAGKAYDLRIEYYEHERYSNIAFTWQRPGMASEVVPNGALTATSAHGLSATYFTYHTLGSYKVAMARTDATVNFDWGIFAPNLTMPFDKFAVGWVGKVSVPKTDTYVFSTTSDDGVRLWIDGKLVIDHWSDHGIAAGMDSATVMLMSDHSYDIKMDYYENSGTAVAKLMWQSPVISRSIVPTSALTTN